MKARSHLTVSTFWPLAIGLALGAAVRAQEIPRPSLARQKEVRPPPEAYNFRVGPVFFLASAGLGIEYDDNIGRTSSGKEGDLVLFPTLGLQALWQISRLNTVEFQTGISYTKYLSHPQLDTQTLLLAPDSAIQFNLYIGDFLIRFRDQFSYQQDPGAQGTVNGVASLGRFTNVAGVAVLWDLNDVTWSVAYDHLTLTTNGATTLNGSASSTDVSFLNRTTDQVSSALTFRTGTSTLSGLEGTVATTSYPENESAGYTSAGVGPFLSLRLTRYTSLNASVGYRRFSSKTSAPTTTADQPGSGFSSDDNPRITGSSASIYANLAIAHRLNRYYSDQLTISRDSDVGLYSDLSETTALTYSSAWTIGRQLAISSALSWQDIREITGALGRAPAPRYQFFGLTLGTGYTLTKRIHLTAAYQYTIKLAGEPAAGYSQNRVRIGFDYRF